jgi:hypothetical protein
MKWLAQSLHEGELVFRLGRDGDVYVADWPGVGTLRAERAASHDLDDAWRSEPNADPLLVAKLRRGPALALLRHLQGRVSLHAATVAFAPESELDLGLVCPSICVVGDSGEGKSTLAAHLCLRHGATLTGDDVAHLEALDGHVEASRVCSHILPSLEEFSLTQAACHALQVAANPLREKTQIVAEKSRFPVPIGAFLTLAFAAGAPRMEPLNGAAKVRALFQSMARFAVDDPARTAQDLDWAVAMASKWPVVHLTRPRDLAALEEASLLLLEYCRTLRHLNSYKGDLGAT